MDAETWHIPLKSHSIIISDALATMESFKLDQNDVPFIIQLFENPKYNIIPGAVTLESHDIIHTLLGRGLLPKDEAYVIGFTMGSSRGLTWPEKRLFRFITRHLYPKGYRFTGDDLEVFEAGVSCAKKMKCMDLSKVDLSWFSSYTIKDARSELGIDVDPLIVDYTLEKLTYNAPESQRLL